MGDIASPARVEGRWKRAAMTGTNVHATSQLYWLSTLVAAVIDIGLVALLTWRLKPERFRKMQWPLVIVSMIFWTALWYVVMEDAFVWETSFRYVFQPWQRWIWPPVFGLISGGIAWLFWRLTLRLPGNPVLYFLLFGGLLSFVDHSVAIRQGVMGTPLLKDVSIASALTFGFFEFIFYWSIILAISSLLDLARERIRSRIKQKSLP
jgi:hypothetical protein